MHRSDDESLEIISQCLRVAGFDYVPAYSVLRDTEDSGGAERLRWAARVIREIHGGIYRTAASLWISERSRWKHLPADPIPQRIVNIRDGKVQVDLMCMCFAHRPPVRAFRALCRARKRVHLSQKARVQPAISFTAGPGP